MLVPHGVPPMASIEAMRPVFLMVMGFALLLIAWRFSRSADRWPARLMMSGAVLLALGYSVILPLYQAGVLIDFRLLPNFPDRDPGFVAAWQVVKVLTMNGGWLLFGLGLALECRVFDSFFERSPQPLKRIPS